MVSPGVALAEPLVQEALDRGVPVLGDIELFARAVRAPVCAITGSNGKSTVTSLVGQMARLDGRAVAVGGNLGEPALDLLDPAANLYVLELSSFQLETTRSLEARVAVVSEPLGRPHGPLSDLEAYAAAKAGIYAGAEIAVVNRDDPRALAMVEADPPTTGFTLGFTLSTPGPDDYGGARRGDLAVSRPERPLLAATDLLIPGRHNLANALAALAMGEACGLDSHACIEALRQFRGLDHRTQFVAERRGVRWYNDSKGTNPGATIAALEGLADPEHGRRRVLIAGGDGKGADFTPLAPVVARAARAVVLIGRDAPAIGRVLAEGTVSSMPST